MSKKVTFTDAKAGDRVWSITEGWGVIRERREPLYQYPLTVDFENGSYRAYTLWGRLYISDLNPTLFWDEVKTETPEKPLPQLGVDAKVIVWKDPARKYRRHFSHFSGGNICTFDAGATSFSKLHRNSITCWPHWELSE